MCYLIYTLFSVDAPIPGSKHRPNSEVYEASGVMSLIFDISRLFCVTPVHLKKMRDGKQVILSRTLYNIHIFVTTLIIMASVVGVLIDGGLDETKTIRFRSPTMRVSWLSNVISTTIAASVGTCGGFTRTKKVLQCMKELQQIKTKIDIEASTSTKEQTKITVFFATLLTLTVLIICDSILMAYDVIILNKDVIVACLYTGYEFHCLVVLLLEMQFVFSALEVHTVLKALNDVLENILKTTKETHPNRRHTTKPVLHSIKELIDMYDVICCIVKKLSDANGLILSVQLATIFVKLVITPFNLVRSYGDVQNPVKLLWLIELPLWNLMHFFCFIMLVEPPHITQMEMARTGILICKLSSLNTDKLISNELSKFSLYLQLHQVTYQPLGICTLSRNLISKTVGVASTYVVTMVQFRP